MIGLSFNPAQISEAITYFLIRQKMQSYRPFDSGRSALLLLDMQSDFFHVGKPGFDKIASVAATLGFKENVDSLAKFCREKGIPVIHAPFVTNNEIAKASIQSTPYYEFLLENRILIGSWDRNSDRGGTSGECQRRFNEQNGGRTRF